MIGGGVLNWNPGDITDDTIMSLTICDMFIKCGDYNQEFLIKEWVKWKDTHPKDIGNWTKNALDAWSEFLKKSKIEGEVKEEYHTVINLYSEHKNAAGNGGVMRCMPVALFEPGLNERIIYSTKICRDTHPDPRCIQSCCLIVESLHEIIENDLTKNEAMDRIIKIGENVIDDDEFADVFLESTFQFDDLEGKVIINGGYTVDTVMSAISGFNISSNFEDALIHVVNQGNDADTTGAVCGSLLGAFYGFSSIPDRWLDTLKITDELIDKGEALYLRKIKS